MTTLVPRVSLPPVEIGPRVPSVDVGVVGATGNNGLPITCGELNQAFESGGVLPTANTAGPGRALGVSSSRRRVTGPLYALARAGADALFVPRKDLPDLFLSPFRVIYDAAHTIAGALADMVPQKSAYGFSLAMAGDASLAGGARVFMAGDVHGTSSRLLIRDIPTAENLVATWGEMVLFGLKLSPEETVTIANIYARQFLPLRKDFPGTYNSKTIAKHLMNDGDGFLASFANHILQMITGGTGGDSGIRDLWGLLQKLVGTAGQTSVYNLVARTPRGATAMEHMSISGEDAEKVVIVKTSDGAKCHAIVLQGRVPPGQTREFIITSVNLDNYTVTLRAPDGTVEAILLFPGRLPTTVMLFDPADIDTILDALAVTSPRPESVLSAPRETLLRLVEDFKAAINLADAVVRVADTAALKQVADKISAVTRQTLEMDVDIRRLLHDWAGDDEFIAIAAARHTLANELQILGGCLQLALNHASEENSKRFKQAVMAAKGTFEAFDLDTDIHVAAIRNLGKEHGVVVDISGIDKGGTIPRSLGLLLANVIANAPRYILRDGTKPRVTVGYDKTLKNYTVRQTATPIPEDTLKTLGRAIVHPSDGHKGGEGFYLAYAALKADRAYINLATAPTGNTWLITYPSR